MLGKLPKYFSIYKELCELMERTGVGHGVACKIVIASVKDSEFASPTCRLDLANLRLQRKHWIEVSTEEHTTTWSNSGCAGFDGKIDTTRFLVDKEGCT